MTDQAASTIARHEFTIARIAHTCHRLAYVGSARGTFI